MNEIKTCVIPAAGLGSRLAPVTYSIPKEMFPIGNKPVIHLLIDEAVQNGVNEFVIVLRRGKEIIIDYLEKLQEKKILEGINIKYVFQNTPRGDGDAVLTAKNLVGDNPFLVLFGDSIVKTHSEKSSSRQIIEAYKKKQTSIIGSILTAEDRVSKVGILEGKNEKIFKVKGFFEKPDPFETNSRKGAMGQYVLKPDIFPYLEKLVKEKEEGEIRLADAFSAIIEENKMKIYGVMIDGVRYDIGSPEGVKEAINAFIN